LLHLERGEEAVVDAFLERINVNGLTEILIGIHVVFAFGSGGEAELNGGGEVLEDGPPVAFVVGAAAMAFVDDDEIKKVGWIFSKIPFDPNGT